MPEAFQKQGAECLMVTGSGRDSAPCVTFHSGCPERLLKLTGQVGMAEQRLICFL